MPVLSAADQQTDRREDCAENERRAEGGCDPTQERRCLELLGGLHGGGAIVAFPAFARGRRSCLLERLPGGLGNLGGEEIVDLAERLIAAERLVVMQANR